MRPRWVTIPIGGATGSMLLVLALVGVGWTVDLERAIYPSPNGAWQLVVDPSERHGAGPGWYRLSAGDDTAWEGRLPFTLQDALVADSGDVHGYAFTRGSLAGGGHLLALAIDASGTMRGLAAEARRSPCCPGAGARPW